MIGETYRKLRDWRNLQKNGGEWMQLQDCADFMGTGCICIVGIMTVTTLQICGGTDYNLQNHRVHVTLQETNS